jgi:hypothetical protein
MPGVHDSNNSVAAAASALLNPQVEQVEQEELEQENLEQETEEVVEEEVAEEESEELEVDEEESEEDESEEQEVGDESDEDDSDEDEEEPDPNLITVKVDGEEYEVSQEELIKGYQLEANYTKKAQALAEEQKKAAASLSQLEEERNKYIKINQHLIQQQAQGLKKWDRVDWDGLKADDPVGYVQKRQEMQEDQAAVQAQYQQLEAALTEKQKVDQVRMQQYVSEQNEVLKKNLEGWNDPEENEAIRKGIASFAQKMGYSESELSQLVSARDLMVINKARLFDELQENKKTVRKKKSAPKVKKKLKSSEPKGKSIKRAQKVKAKRDQAKSSGTTQDAAALMLELAQNRSIKR